MVMASGPLRPRFLFLCFCLPAFLMPFCFGQDSSAIFHGRSTVERVRDESTWWPTKRLPAAKRYAGAQACAQCHSDIYDSQSRTAMARTAMAAADSTILHAGSSIRLGAYTYAVARAQSGMTLTISAGADSVRKPLTWAFGDGSVGQSYVSQESNSYTEERFTYFASTHSFGLTPGRIDGVPVTMPMALGRPVSNQEARKCFVCHTTGMNADPELDPNRLMMGVTCEACHGPGADHAEDPALSEAGGQAHIFNPARLTPTESVDFCGSCHSTWWDTELMGATGLATVRFPAYRLEKSRCWGNGDARLTCVACHNPHQPLVHEAAAYDHNCLACHSPATGVGKTAAEQARVCPVSTKDCVTCHMPKYELPEMHAKFTDHNIRVVRAGAGFPD